MSDAPLELKDDDFASEAPPGYRSQKHKDRFLPLMITLAFVLFIAQIAVPMIVMTATTGSPIMNPAAQGVPQFAKFAVWQDALWYPTISIFGGGQGRSKLAAFDLEGRSLKQPALSLDMQPDWLLGDGEKLWAVSQNEVAEVFADGSVPLVMRPNRFLLNASRPFLHEGRLMVFDCDEDEPFHWYVFVDGEWNDLGEVALPAESLPSDFGRENRLSDSDLDAPADAIEVDNEEPAAMNPDLSEDFSDLYEPSLHLAAVSTPQGLSLFATDRQKVYHRIGVPLATADLPTPQWSDWEFVGTGLGTTLYSAAILDEPAVVLSGDQTWEVWRRSGDRWAVLPVDADIHRPGYFSDLGVVSLPDSGRTLMVVEEFGGGFGSPLLELKPDGISQIATVGSPFTFNNPFADTAQFWQLPMQIATYAVLIVQVLLIHWLMQSHRDPHYYKGTAAVEYASVLRRVIASIIDTAIVYGPLVVLWMGFFPEFSDPLEILKRLENDPQQFFLDLLPPLGYSAAWVFGCAFVMWLMLSFGGFSPGKYLCGVRVATTNLERPGLLRGLVRTIVWPFESFMFNGLGAFVLIAFTPHWQRLADLVGGLIVVKAGSLRNARQATTL